MMDKHHVHGEVLAHPGDQLLHELEDGRGSVSSFIRDKYVRLVQYDGITAIAYDRPTKLAWVKPGRFTCKIS